MKRQMAVLLALLMLLTGCAAKEAPAAAVTPAPEQGMEIADSALQRREDVETLVIGAVAYDEDGNSKVSSLSVLVRNARNELAVMTIPKDTRVWVERYDAQGVYQYCRYGAISEVYHAAESAGLGAQKTMEAVSTLLGGVRLENYILLNVVQLEQLTKITGNVMINVEDAITEYGIPSGFQDITPKIRAYASYSYLNSLGGVEYLGTDPYKLQRHQQLIETVLSLLVRKTERMQSREEKLEYARSVLDCVTTDMDEETLLKWMDRDLPEITEASILKGMQNERSSESYWICDRSALKEWVVEQFYVTEE